MKKRLLAITCLSALAFGATAEMLVDLQFSEADGTTLENAVNSGTTGNFTNNIAPVKMNGLGQAVVSGVTSNETGTAKFSVGTVSTGKIRLEMGISGWHFVGDKDDARAVQLQANGDDLKLKLEEQKGITKTVRPRALIGADKFNINNLANLSEPNGTMILNTLIDLDAETYTAAYTYNGTETAFTTSGVWTNGAIESIGFGIIGNADWTTEDYVNIDYIQVETIPEPHSIGLMLVATATGLLLRNGKRKNTIDME